MLFESPTEKRRTGLRKKTQKIFCCVEMFSDAGALEKRVSCICIEKGGELIFDTAGIKKVKPRRAS